MRTCCRSRERGVEELTILGAGSWGTALSIVLGPRFERVRLWARDSGLADRVGSSRENSEYLPGFRLPNNVELTDSLGEALEDAEIVLLVIPSQHLRTVFRNAAPYLSPSMLFVSATKGIETTSRARMSEVAQSECPFPARIATLSGPTFAQEIAKGEPAAVVIASPDHDWLRRFNPLSRDRLCGCTPIPTRWVWNWRRAEECDRDRSRYLSGARSGKQYGCGAGYPRTAEITRLAMAAGGEAKTLAGLAGLGDLVLTCTGELSRNRRVGIELGKGRSSGRSCASTSMVAEGVETTFAAVDLAKATGWRCRLRLRCTPFYVRENLRMQRFAI